MPPLQDITHRFVSPLPPSSPPALSYIDDDDIDHGRAGPSSAFLNLSTSSNPLHPRPISVTDSASGKKDKENLPPFEVEDGLELGAGPSNVIFSTPKSRTGGAKRSPPSSDPFGFLALERRLKAQREQAKRIRDDVYETAGPVRKRQKFDPAASPSQLHMTRLSYRTPGRANKSTQTPLYSIRHTTGIRTISPPAATPLHQKGRKQRRSTLVFDNGNSPFLDSHASTPSPSKRYKRPNASVGNIGKRDSNVIDDSVLSLPMPSQLTAAASPIRRRRKRARLADLGVENDVTENPNETLSVLAGDSDALANTLRSRLPKKRGLREESIGLVTPIQKEKRKAEETKSRSRKTAGKGDGEDEEGGKRRSARLAKRDPLAIHKGTTKANRPVRKAKGKENAGKKTDAKINAKKASTNMKGKGKNDEVPDDVTETWERERAARLAYFKKLDSYELETESIYVI
ncbi:hypothetical protein AX15_006388 [Amanita polypyramis BW_CC]|nr:hypothetical protein AX15_006388 [Amanita polypyramis BW_CC]